MPPKGGYQWPTTFEKYMELRAKACTKFEPLISNLQPWELDALAITAGAELKKLRQAAQQEAAARGEDVQPQGLGNRRY